MSDLTRRVETLETDMREVKGILARMEPMLIRMDERMNHLATKAELAEKPGKTYMSGVVGVMTAAVFAAVVLGASLT